MADQNEARPDSLAGLFPVLRQLRLRARLTQRQIAEATGSGGRHGHKLIARLEAGHVPNPSVRLLLDYLRACGAGPGEKRGHNTEPCRADERLPLSGNPKPETLPARSGKS